MSAEALNLNSDVINLIAVIIFLNAFTTNLKAEDKNLNAVKTYFISLNSEKRLFTLLLLAVLSVITMPISVCPNACFVLNWLIAILILLGCKLLHNCNE